MTSVLILCEYTDANAFHIGGISFFSPQVGMVCDNILEYEIVLANSTILRASESENGDLWKSLKGGSGNFGIVTRFIARTFPSTTVWAGFSYYAFAKVPKLVSSTNPRYSMNMLLVQCSR